MNIVVVAGGIICAVLVLVGAYALSLPDTREGMAQIQIEADPPTIVAIIENVEEQPAWRPGIESVTREGSGWTERTRTGETVRFTWIHKSADRLALAFESSAGYTGEWTANLESSRLGTLVSVVERARVPNPLTRLLAKLFFNPEKFAADYLAALKAHAEVRS